MIQLVRKWKAAASPYEYLTDKPHVWRDLFQSCLKGIKVEQWGFRPYSLRRGGATSLFVKVGSLDRVLILGRWTAVKTAKIYLNSGLAMLADIQISKTLLRPFHQVYHNFLSSVQTLEPTLLKKSRTGGRGSNQKQAKKASKSVRKNRLKEKNDLGCGLSFASIFCLVQKNARGLVFLGLARVQGALNRVCFLLRFGVSI